MRRLGAALAACLLLASGAAPVRAAAVGACPTIVAHRANPIAAPENTVPGIASVPATGAGSVELDVQWSSSGFPVLMHDSTVDRTTPGSGPASSLGLGQLRALLAQDYAPWRTDPRFVSTKVPYGYDFMAAVRDADLDLLVDVSGTPTEVGMEKLRIYVQDYFGWADRILVMGSAIRVAQMRAWEPGLRYVVIEYPGADTLRRGESLAALGAVGYAVPARDITPAAVAYWHASGLEVMSWSSDSPSIDVPATWQRLAAAGVDQLVTNRPADALALLCGTGG